MLLQPAGNSQGAFILALHPQAQCFHSPQQVVCVRRSESRTIDLPEMVQPLDQLFAAAGRTAQRIGVTTQKLGRAVQNEIRTELERVLIDRCCKRIIDRDDCANSMGGSGEPRDVHVVEATPPGVFDQAAINAVKHWRYAPLLVNGAAVDVPVRTRMRFELPK